MKRLWEWLRLEVVRLLTLPLERIRAPQRAHIASLKADIAKLRTERAALQADKQTLKAKVKAQKEAFRPHKELSRELTDIFRSLAAVHDRGSLTSGRPDWAEKWRTAKGKRILYFTKVDYAGSFYKWAEAVNAHTDHAVRMVSLFRHRFGYPLDILYTRGHLIVEVFPEMMHSLYELADEADIIHLKDQTGFFDGHNRLPKDTLAMFGKPTVYTLYGGTARLDEGNQAFRDYVRSHDAVIAMTPDLSFDWLDSVFIPHSIDIDAFPYRWVDGKLILHTPSTPARKGTAMFRAAAERVAREVGGRVEIVTDTTHDYVMREKPKATLFFDQAGRESDALGAKHIGWYGNSALEAAVFGIPTMAYISPEAIRQAKRVGFEDAEDCAILNTPPSEEGLYATMAAFFGQPEGRREEAARRTRKWIEDHHSYQRTAHQLDQVYRSL